MAREGRCGAIFEQAFLFEKFAALTVEGQAKTIVHIRIDSDCLIAESEVRIIPFVDKNQLRSGANLCMTSENGTDGTEDIRDGNSRITCGRLLSRNIISDKQNRSGQGIKIDPHKS